MDGAVSGLHLVVSERERLGLRDRVNWIMVIALVFSVAFGSILALCLTMFV